MVLRLDRVAEDRWSEWREVRLRALADSPQAFSSTLEDWERAEETRWRARLRDVPFNILARRGERAIGMISASVVRSGDALLVSMWVAPEARGQGVGDALIGAVIRWAREQGAGRIGLDVRESNRTAQSLYRRNGFRESGPPRPSGDGIPELHMSRSVPSR